MTEPLKGSCLCGAIAYEADSLTPHMGHCHCSMCRKFHGAAFATFGEVPSSQFRWTRGEDQLKTYTAPNGTQRMFCPHCGSSLTFAPANHDGSLVEFALGTLDTPCPQKPDAHIFTAFKADWSTISDGLPVFAEGRVADD